MTEYTYTWIFNGSRSRFPSGVFADRPSAEAWIAKHRLSGTLTRYPVGIPFYDWAIETGKFTVKGPKHQTPEFIETFTCASAEHYHYVNGSA